MQVDGGVSVIEELCRCRGSFGNSKQALGIASGWGSIGGGPPPLPELYTDHAFVTASSHNPSGKFGYM
jgi:hypothetical protein